MKQNDDMTPGATEDGLTRPILPFGLSIRDLARIPLVAALVVAVVVLYLNEQSLQSQVLEQAHTCVVAPPLASPMPPTEVPDGI